MSLIVETDELQRLASAIQSSEGSYLAFLVCPDLRTRKEVLTSLGDLTPNVGWHTVPLSKGEVQLYQVSDAFHSARPASGKKRRGYLIYDFDMPASELYLALQGLNWYRERLVALKSPVVFIAPEGVMAELARGAPDLWAVRGGLYLLGQRQPSYMSPTSEAMPGGDEEHSRLPYDELTKRERLYRDIVAREETQESPNKALLARLYRNIGDIRFRLGYLQEALKWFRNCLAIAEGIRDYHETAYVMNSIGLLYLNKGMLDEALKWLQESLTIAEDIKYHQVIVAAMNNIGSLYHDRDMIDEALDWLQRSLSLAEDSSDQLRISVVMNSIGALYREKGKLDEAMELVQRSLSIAKDIGDRMGIAAAKNNIGNLYVDKGMLDEALQWYQQALDIKEGIGHRQGMALTIKSIGVLYYKKGMLDEAMEWCQRSLTIREEIDDRIGIAHTLGDIFLLHLENQEPNKALLVLKRSLSLKEELGLPLTELELSFLNRVRSFSYDELQRAMEMATDVIENKPDKKPHTKKKL